MRMKNMMNQYANEKTKSNAKAIIAIGSNFI